MVRIAICRQFIPLPFPELDEGMADEYLMRESFLDTEITKLLKGLHRQFTGDDPVCLSVFQPTANGGHLVFLDRYSEVQLRMRPGLSAHKSFLDADLGVTWGTVIEAQATLDTIEYYVYNNGEDVRRGVAAIYRRRFHGKVEVLPDGHVPVGTVYKLCFVCPRPDYSNTSDYRRVPRLGIIYSFGEFRSDVLLTADMLTAADKILRVRLTTLLEYQGKFCPKVEAQSREKKTRSAYEMARAVATDLPTSPDEKTFLAAKLLLTHHFFFPHDPVSAMLFQQLTDDAGSVFKRHGLAEFVIAVGSNMVLDDLIVAVTHDIAYLIASCDHNTMDSSGKEQRTEIIEKMKQPIRFALALLCGSYCRRTTDDTDYVTIKPPKSLKLEIGESAWPIFSFSKFSTWAASAKAEDGAKSFLESLHPEGPLASRTAERYNNTDVLRERRDGTWSVLGYDEWYISYGRARCTLDFLADQKIGRKQSSSGCDDPPIRTFSHHLENVTSGNP